MIVMSRSAREARGPGRSDGATAHERVAPARGPLRISPAYARRRADRRGRAGGATVTCSVEPRRDVSVSDFRTVPNQAQPRKVVGAFSNGSLNADLLKAGISVVPSYRWCAD